MAVSGHRSSVSRRLVVSRAELAPTEEGKEGMEVQKNMAVIGQRSVSSIASRARSYRRGKWRCKKYGGHRSSVSRRLVVSRAELAPTEEGMEVQKIWRSSVIGQSSVSSIASRARSYRRGNGGAKNMAVSGHRSIVG